MSETTESRNVAPDTKYTVELTERDISLISLMISWCINESGPYITSQDFRDTLALGHRLEAVRRQ